MPQKQLIEQTDTRRGTYSRLRVKAASEQAYADVPRPSRQEISLQVLDTDRHHCQNCASVGVKLPIS